MLPIPMGLNHTITVQGAGVGGATSWTTVATYAFSNSLIIPARAQIIAVAGDPAVSGVGYAPVVRVFQVNTDPQTKAISTQLINSFAPYDIDFTGGIHVAVGDFNGDGTRDILVAPASGAVNNVLMRAYDGSSGGVLFQCLLWTGSSIQGANIAVGDVNNDGKDDYAVAPTTLSGDTWVFNGTNNATLAHFTAYGTRGVQLAILSGGLVYTTTGAGDPGTAECQIWVIANGVATNPGTFTPQNYSSGGDYIATGLDSQGGLVVFGDGFGAQPYLESYWFGSYQIATCTFGDTLGFWGGISVACRDLNADGNLDIVTAPGDNSDEAVYVWNARNNNSNEFSFSGFDSTFYNGSISVAC